MSYKCEIVADSVMPQGHRLTTYLITYPRIIHAEMCRHRILSRNTAISRAVPFKKMVKDVESDPFIPIAFQRDHEGMQGTEYIKNEYSVKPENPGDNDLDACIKEWLYARNGAVLQAKELNQIGVTKQLCNRLLESFMWTTELVSGTEWENFFSLRCPMYVWEELPGNLHVYRSKKDALRDIQGRGYDITNLLKQSDIEWMKMNQSQAEIHIQKIAEMMYDVMNENKPNELEAGEWHIPFGDNINSKALSKLEDSLNHTDTFKEELSIKISTARAARLSYMTFDGEIDYEKDIQLHNRLLESKHFSCFEHSSKAMTHDEYYSFRKGFIDMDSIEVIDEGSLDNGWCNNFRGFINYRYLLENKLL